MSYLLGVEAGHLGELLDVDVADSLETLPDGLQHTLLLLCEGDGRSGGSGNDRSQS